MLLVDEAETITATFHPLTYTVTVTVTGGDGSSLGGHILMEPAGPYYYGQDVTLSAIPNAGYGFIGWDINTDLSEGSKTRWPDRVITITVTDDKQLTANFVTDPKIYLPIISAGRPTR